MREYINGNIRYITNAHGIIRCEWVKPERFMFLSDLSVNIDKRRKGYGRELMEYVLQLAKSTACEVVTLRVKGSEQWLVKWYERLGFHIVMKDWYEEGMLVMSKIL